MEGWTTRRRLLGMLGSAGVAGTAGCSTLGSGAGESARSPLYADWMPWDGGTDNREWKYKDLTAIRDRRGSLAESTYYRLAGTRPGVEQYGVDGANVTEALWMDLAGGFVSVAAGEFDVNDVTSTLEEFNYGEREENGEFTVFTAVLENPGSDSPIYNDVAISASHLVVAQSYTDRPSMTDVLETPRGNHDSLRQRDDDVAALLDVHGDSSYVHAQTYEDDSSGGKLWVGWSQDPPETVGFAQDYAIGNDETDLTLAFLYESSEDVDLDAIDEFRDRERVLAAYENTATSRDGRLAKLEGSVPTSRFNFLRQVSPNRRSAPASVQFEYDEEGDELLVELSSYSGDPPWAERVVVRVNGERAGVIEPIDLDGSTTVTASQGDTVSVIAVNDDGEERPIRKFYP